MEYSGNGLLMKVDGDVFECMGSTTSDRVPLDRLAVRVDKHAKGKVRLHIQVAAEPIPQEPIYGWGMVYHYISRHMWVLDTDQEPGVREFFVQVGAACGRPVGPARGAADGGETKRRKLFGRS